MTGEEAEKGKERKPGIVARTSPGVDPREFFPDLLRIQQTPPRPMPRVVLFIALAFFAGALLWALFGQLDIVAVAQGKLVPKSYLKILQPSEAGIVREILVREGEHVKAGQVLMRMDTTLATADLKALEAEYEQNQLTLRRIDAELRDKPFEQQPGDSAELFREVYAQYRANRQAHEASLDEERAARERASHEYSAAKEVKEKLEKILPLYQEQDENYRQLAEQGYVGKLAAGEKTRERIEKEEELKTQVHLISREKAAMSQSEMRLAQLRSTYIKRLRDERQEVALRQEQLEQELAKQGHRQKLMELRAQQDGKVKSLATHTVGTVAQPGTILMTLVPDGEPLYVEIWLSNEDVGFVREGLEAKVKLAAYRFQKYGMLDGMVDYVAADAEEKKPESSEVPLGMLAYRSLVKLGAQRLESGGVSHSLVPGMQVTVEINLGKRSVIEYILSPVRKAFQEAGRER